MRTRAKRVDGGWVLAANKIWSTLAHVADRILVLARTADGDKPLARADDVHRRRALGGA